MSNKPICRVCDSLMPADETLRFAPIVTGGPACCSRECARTAHVADAINRLIDTLEQGGALIEVREVT